MLGVWNVTEYPYLHCVEASSSESGDEQVGQEFGDKVSKTQELMRTKTTLWEETQGLDTGTWGPSPRWPWNSQWGLGQQYEIVSSEEGHRWNVLSRVRFSSMLRTRATKPDLVLTHPSCLRLPRWWGRYASQRALTLDADVGRERGNVM